jgi:hypothetical protein
MLIYNVSNPNEIDKSGYYNTGSKHTWDVEVSGKYAYIGTDNKGLHIVDISSPSESIKKVGYYSGPKRIEELAVSGDYAYLAADEDGFEIIDISNPGSPTQAVGYKEANFTPYRISVYGIYAFLSGWDDDDKLRVFNISKPNDPKLEYTLENSYNIEKIVIKNGKAYLVSGEGISKFKIYRVYNLGM